MSTRRLACAVVGATTGLTLLAGCGGGTSGESADTPTTTSSSSSSAAETSPPDLTSGLLTQEQFGADATVVPITRAQLEAGAGLSAMGKDLTVTPEECAPAVQSTQPDLDAFDDIAAVTATSGSVVTVEVLLRGGPTQGVADVLASAVEACPQAQVSSPDIGTATVTFEPLPAEDIGDAGVALRYTTVVDLPDGTHVTVPALLGVFEDGDRLGIVTTLSDPSAPSATAPDPAAFADVLQQAYQVQSDALG
jgi:hypothetical protein